MACRIIDGKAIAAEITQELKGKVAEFTRRYGSPPLLSVVLVGDDPASHVYVRRKERACGEGGIGFERQQLPAGTSQAQLGARASRPGRPTDDGGTLAQRY